MNLITGFPILEEVKNHPAWLRLEDQLAWYDGRSSRDKRWYKTLRFTELCLAAAIPVVSFAGGEWSKLITAIFGGMIAVFEGAQQLNQFGPQWIQYRSTAEYLKHEKFLFLSQSGHYRNVNPEDALRILAERVEENVSQEHARWTSASRQVLEEKHT